MIAATAQTVNESANDGTVSVVLEPWSHLRRSRSLG
jgi:hypothetical protein